MPTTVITFGTFDLLHCGHLRLLQRAAARGDRLVVGVSSDILNVRKKMVHPTMTQNERMEIVAALRCVDEIFLEESLEDKAFYCQKYRADVLVMGDDHKGRFDEMCKGVCKVEYLPRTKGVSSTKIKRKISSASLTSLRTKLPNSCNSKPLHLKKSGENYKSVDMYSATGKNLVHATKQSNPITEFLIKAHDNYYDLVMRVCTPFCAVMPRDIHVSGRRITVFSANVVTYARGLLIFPIVHVMKSNYLWTAAFLVMFHDFLDHLDGVVAKQQARDGRNKGDDGAYGAFLDAQMDKLVFCLCLWSILILMDCGCGFFVMNAAVMITSISLFVLELVIAAVRTADYFAAKYAPEKGSRALRAVSEGKLKQKFESVGIALYCLWLPNPVLGIFWTVVGTLCLWLAIYFSFQSLRHKLQAHSQKSDSNEQILVTAPTSRILGLCP